MDELVLSTTKAANHIGLKKDLMKIGINKDTAANIAHIYLFRLAKEQKNKVINILNNY